MSAAVVVLVVVLVVAGGPNGIYTEVGLHCHADIVSAHIP